MDKSNSEFDASKFFNGRFKNKTRTPFLTGGQNSPIFDRTKLSSFKDDRPKANIKKVFNMMYQDTSLSSGTRFQNKLKNKKE